MEHECVTRLLSHPTPLKTLNQLRESNAPKSHQKYANTELQTDFCSIRRVICDLCLQCFDVVGWAAGRASGL